ncbi:MAG TPA: hypothetical protein VHM66_05350 [Solirubrobacterales bacterium]|nr:hypothetical protein [Solirubrobacterales bacterium]
MTGALPAPPEPEPALAPLVWVTTGVLVPLPEPEPALAPLVWVTTGLVPEPDSELTGADEEPLVEVVTGLDEEE